MPRSYIDIIKDRYEGNITGGRLASRILIKFLVTVGTNPRVNHGPMSLFLFTFVMDELPRELQEVLVVPFDKIKKGSSKK